MLPTSGRSVPRDDSGPALRCISRGAEDAVACLVQGKMGFESEFPFLLQNSYFASGTAGNTCLEAIDSVL